MKELSIEEKAKRYDEAIERAKNYHSPEAVCNVKIAMENLFPELREHEDERIRKALIKFTRENQYMYTNYNGYNITKEEFITWLEKQGEQKSTEWSEVDEIKIGDIRDAITLDDELEESYKEKLYDFLKSLRPQNRWKPSDRQMEVLITISNKEILSEYESGMLIGLYTELQKLREK